MQECKKTNNNSYYFLSMQKYMCTCIFKKKSMTFKYLECFLGTVNEMMPHPHTGDSE